MLNQKDDIKPTKRQRLIKELQSFSLIFFLVFTFRSSFYEPFKIPSGSMIPTLVIGDFILVNKMKYGFKIPYTEFLDKPIYIGGTTNPKRGEVIVFRSPKDESRDFIKRVIGLPGDEVEIKNNIVYVNGIEIKMKEIAGEKFLEDMDDQFKNYRLKFYQVNEKENKYFIQHNEDEYHQQNYPKTVVEKDHYFVMGDNRDFSNDSRIWGQVHRETIKGKAILIWFSMIFPFSDHAVKFRPWRIGNFIQ